MGKPASLLTGDSSNPCNVNVLASVALSVYGPRDRTACGSARNYLGRVSRVPHSLHVKARLGEEGTNPCDHGSFIKLMAEK